MTNQLDVSHTKHRRNVVVQIILDTKYHRFKIENRNQKVKKKNNLNLTTMKLKGGFRNTQWDPFLLCTQIIALQTILYVNLGAIMAIMDLFVDANHTLDHIFQYHVSRPANGKKLNSNRCTPAELPLLKFY